MKEYEMSEEDFQVILDACQPTPYLCTSGGDSGPSTQANVNGAWTALGAKMGFQPFTAVPGVKGDRFFLAEPVRDDDV